MLRVLLGIAFATVLWFLVFQVFIPLWLNRRLFPIFRKDLREAHRRIEEANRKKNISQYRVEEATIESDVADLDIRANKIIDNACDAIVSQNRNTLRDIPRKRLIEEDLDVDIKTNRSNK